MAVGALSLVNKIHNIPDLGTAYDAFQMRSRIQSNTIDRTRYGLTPLELLGIGELLAYVNQFEDTRDNILQENKPFTPNAGMKYIGWLTRTFATKSASSVINELRGAKMQIKSLMRV
ncbi:hypothetical protein HZ326_23302 [Fusarium oxysporum f. sp. albedinis]|nr:hypothetical protein HZ326_23302 [Fusarium oxysporum f. sp. albedinis]